MANFQIEVSPELVSHLPARQVTKVHVDAHGDDFFVVPHTIKSSIHSKILMTIFTEIFLDSSPSLCFSVALFNVILALAVLTDNRNLFIVRFMLTLLGLKMFTHFRPRRPVGCDRTLRGNFL